MRAGVRIAQQRVALRQQLGQVHGGQAAAIGQHLPRGERAGADRAQHRHGEAAVDHHARSHFPAVAIERAGDEAAILHGDGAHPVHADFQRAIPGAGKAVRAGPVAQVIGRPRGQPDTGRRPPDMADLREHGDEGDLRLRRPPARADAEQRHGGEGQIGLVRFGGGGGRVHGAGAYQGRAGVGQGNRTVGRAPALLVFLAMPDGPGGSAAGRSGCGVGLREAGEIGAQRRVGDRRDDGRHFFIERRGLRGDAALLPSHRPGRECPGCDLLVVQLDEREMARIAPDPLERPHDSLIGSFERLYETPAAHDEQARHVGGGICPAGFCEQLIEFGRRQDRAGGADVEEAFHGELRVGSSIPIVEGRREC